MKDCWVIVFTEDNLPQIIEILEDEFSEHSAKERVKELAPGFFDDELGEKNDRYMLSLIRYKPWLIENEFGLSIKNPNYSQKIFFYDHKTKTI